MTDALFDMPAVTPEGQPVPPAQVFTRAIAVYPLVPTRSFDAPLTWGLPDELAEKVVVGSIVEVPLGKAARVGVVAAVDVELPAGVALKGVNRVIDTPPIPAPLVGLAEWIADQYGCARTMAMALVVNPRFAAQARASSVPHRKRQLAVRRIVERVDGIDLTARQRAIAQQVPMAWGSVSALLQRIGTTRPTVGKLAEAGVLEIEERFLDELAAADAEEEGSAGTDPSMEELLETARTAAARPSLVELTRAQLDAVERIWTSYEPGNPDKADPATLLVGITGSGKTEVYLEAIARALDEGQGAIVLVPEIALTPQTARRFLLRFPGIVEVLHSGMTRAQRAVAHDRIARGVARVVVGPRSAIFAPVQPLGIIVIDEEHDGSYKQDSEPRYDARRVAFRRAISEQARLVFGSATPRPESWQGIKRRVIMRERPGGGRLSPVKLIDLRDHAETYPLSMPVQDAIDETLRRGRKVIVLHNRRGYAVALHCRGCGHTFRCNRCDVSLVVHGRTARRQRMTCHHCGFDGPVPEQCTECRSTDIARMGAGTEQIESLLAERWAGTPVHRLDADAVRTRGAVSEILAAFNEPGPAILIGTQMVAKGHDFPDVELAVVVDADAGLAIPDFRSEERAFALVAQLAGRAGRSAATAEHAQVLIQTWDPNHAFLGFARSHDVEGFLERELRERELHGFPPFTRIVRVLISARDEATRDRWATAVADGMRQLKAGTVLGPARLLRINDRERSHVLVTTAQAAHVAASVRRFLGTSESGRRKVDVRVLLDVDPQSLL